MGWIDIALWDLAGKHYNAPIYELLGGYRKKLPAYASTYHGDTPARRPEQPRGLSPTSPSSAWRWATPPSRSTAGATRPSPQEVATVLAVGRRVGGKMDLMIDPACEYNTFADALKVGRACDEAGFFWFEDPFKDGGISQFAHRKLRQMIKTPLLQCEHVRGVEPKWTC